MNDRLGNKIYKCIIYSIEKPKSKFSKQVTINVENPKQNISSIVSFQITLSVIKNLNLGVGSIVFIKEIKNYSWKIDYDELCKFYGVDRIETH